MYNEICGKYTVLFEGDKVGSLDVSQKGLMIEVQCQCICAAAVVLKLAVLTGNSRKVIGVMMPEGDKLNFKKKYSKNDLKQLSIESIEGCYLITGEEAERPFDISKTPIEIVETSKTQSALAPELEAEPASAPAPEPAAEPVSAPAPEPAAEPVLASEPEPAAEPVSVLAPEPSNLAVDKKIEPKNDFLFKEWVNEEDPQSLFSDEELRQVCQSVSGTLKKHLDNGNIMLAMPFIANEPFPLMQIFCFGESMSIRDKNYLVFQIKDGKLFC